MHFLVHVVFPLEYCKEVTVSQTEEGIQNDDIEEEKDAHYASEARNMASLKLLYPKRKIKNLNILTS